MNIKLEVITPAKAKEYLGVNYTNNRTLNDRKIAEYATDMKNGNWFAQTGESIKFSEDGTLIDGQHRLHAIILANIPVKLLVSTEVPFEAFQYIDSGSTRTSGDVLHIAGIPSANQTAALVKMYLSFHKSLKADYTFHSRIARGALMIANSEIVAEYQSRPDFWKSVYSHMTKFYASGYHCLSPKVIGGWFAVLSDINAEKAIEFFKSVFINRGEFKTSDVLFDILMKSKTTSFKITDIHKDAILIKAWNSFYENKPVNKQLRYAMDEKFPVIAGVDELRKKLGLKKSKNEVYNEALELYSSKR